MLNYQTKITQGRGTLLAYLKVLYPMLCGRYFFESHDHEKPYSLQKTELDILEPNYLGT